MSGNMQQQQPNKDYDGSQNTKQPGHVKRVLDFFFKSITSPGFVSERIAIFCSCLVTALIFVLDVVADPIISFHPLYIFPLIFISFHSSRTSMVVTALALSTTLQLCELLFLQHPAVTIPVYLVLLIAISNIICVLVARYVREHILEANRLSTIDPLTQLCNRRGFEKSIEAEVRRQSRYGGDLSLVVMDVDGFKGLNDTRGHKSGDQALILLADILRNQTRLTDTIARLGGDEFVILMPNTKAADCQALCHLFCHTIRLMLTETFSYPLSVSIGFVDCENLSGNFVDILSIADNALYRAKEEGKSRVVRGTVEEFSAKETIENNSTVTTIHNPHLKSAPSSYQSPYSTQNSCARQ